MFLVKLTICLTIYLLVTCERLFNIYVQQQKEKATRQLCLPIHLEARTLLKFKEIVTVLSDQSVTRSVPFSRSFSQLSELTDFNQFSVCVKCQLVNR